MTIYQAAQSGLLRLRRYHWSATEYLFLVMDSTPQLLSALYFDLVNPHRHQWHYHPDAFAMCNDFELYSGPLHPKEYP